MSSQEPDLGNDDDAEYEEVVEELEVEEEESYLSGSYDEEEEEEDVTDDDDGDEQENLLSFATFPLDGLRGQHIMVVAAFNRFIVVGTNRGLVTLTEATGIVFRTLNKHVDPISDVSCDMSEEHVGSSDKAGVVTVQNLYDERDSYRKEFDVPTQSIALHPRYSRNEDRPIVVGGGDKVMLITKTMFLGHRKATVLQERRGKVHVVRWCGPDLIAWANDRGVQLYSYTSRAMVQLVPRPADSPRLELYRCSLIWEAPRTLICGWGDWVQVMHVHELRMEERLRWGTEFLTRTHRVDVMPAIRTHSTREPCRVCGIAPFGADRYFLLVCTIEQEGHMKELEVRIVERVSFADVYRGRLQTKYKHPLQFSLAFSGGGTGGREGATAVTETAAAAAAAPPLLPLPSSSSSASPLDVLSGSAYFIVCVDTVVKAIPISNDDHVEYLIQMDRFEEAYEYAGRYPLRRLQLANIGKGLLQHLFAGQKYKDVVSLLTEILGSDYAEWERWICQFDQHGVSDMLVNVLPPSYKSNAKDGDSSQGRTDSRIGEEYYELVLFRCLEKDVLSFSVAVHKFKGLFRCDVVCRAVELRYNNWKLHGQSSGISDEQLTALGDAYGLLLRLNGQYDEALQVLLQVDQSGGLFEFVREKGLFAKAIEILPELFTRNEDKTIELLLEYRETMRHATGKSDAEDVSSSTQSSLAPAAVVQRLEKTERRYLWAYLKALQTRDRAAHAAVSRSRAQLVAALFIENEPSGLLAFLRENSTHLPNLKEIYALCKKHQLLEETVFLLARMGKEEEGLRIIVQDMKSMKKALQYIADIPSEEDQRDLFDKLLHMCLEVNAALPSYGGQRYFEYRPTEGETWSSIAKKYEVDEEELCLANTTWKTAANKSNKNTSSSGSHVVSPSGTCVVPLNLIQALLHAVVDPSISGHAALNALHVVELLPEGEPIPHVASCIAAVACSKANDVRLMAAVADVAATDLEKQYGTLYRRQIAAIRVSPGVSLCPFCLRQTFGSSVVFGCSHVYHASCVITYLAGEDALLVQPSEVDISHFFRRPEDYLRPEKQRTSPRCFVCYQVREGVK
ncbi:vacuolar assembly protein vps41 [Trypanosoma grayi]|uniref:vacuolar assembly protein vps41 n=1 Tax=Trypanosoma grayi TaxID=71804 RepID=UPI0004F3FA6C|nr:vacuolar assembly protein vps41 [Trypanosoma grayi]KEG09325.1 vacuolar assembly protein vps41 [Trypanosoma grayi]